MSSSDADRAAGRTSPYPTRNGTVSPPLPSTSLSHIHIADALKQSPDNGATLDLTHRNLTDVGESGAEELATIGREDIMEDESSVLRMALGYNRLATLPMAFALLSRLRYLNLKNNSFSVFPDVLTVMPSLEILDMSRNKIKRLPSQPGSLAGLRVFCISRNKLTRLPSYLSSFRNLNILKTDHNPLEWPPKVIMEPFGGVEDPQIMRGWIKTVQKWMEDNSTKAEDRKASDDSISAEKTDLDGAVDDSIRSWSKFPILDNDFDEGVTPHARSLSMDSDFSDYSVMEEPAQSSDQTSLDSPEHPPPLRLGVLPLFSNLPSPSRSPDSYLPTPEASVSSTDDDVTAVIGSLQQQHARNASYAGGSRSASRSALSGKKSLPDLRTAKLNFGTVKNPPNLPIRGYTTELSNGRLEDGFSMPSPSSQRDDSGSSDGRPIRRTAKTVTREPILTSPTARDQPAPSMDVERNSYFRRLSTLPSSTISTAIPPSLLSLIDAARSILFAVSQVYQTLQHYTVYAIDERLSSVLRKVLDPASTYMMQLINSLDRFDSMSRRTLPPPAVCRSIIECCKDTVAVFGKAVGVLALQLKVLATHDDVRYLRQMLLVLYGATAEISHAWQAMKPHIEAVKPLLREHRKPPVAKSHPAQTSQGRIPPASGPIGSEPASAPSTSQGSYPVSSPMSRPQISQPRTARRHAGSFSSKDVEIGKKLPSYEEIPQTPLLRPGLRQLAMMPSPTINNGAFQQHFGSSSGSRSATVGDHSRQGSHSRQDSQSSLRAISASSSPSLSMHGPMLEIPPNSKTLVDKEALDAMSVAVEAAPAVWEMMDEILSEADVNHDVEDTLAKAKVVTDRLRENIRAVQKGHPAADRKTLREDAHVFVKTVVQLSNVIKNYGGAHTIFPDLRSRMVKLTNSTEEFVILLHVSSFSPSTRSHSPMLLGPSQSGLLVAPEDRLGASLSRSRSAQSAASQKLAVLSKDGPRSALPNQSFNIPMPPRLGTRNRDGGSDTPDGPG